MSRFFLQHNNLSNGALAEIAASLSDYTSLKSFNISDNSLIGRGECVSLGTIIKWPAALHLEEIFLAENNFNDEDMSTLVAALTNAANLRQLSLSRNQSITATDQTCTVVSAISIRSDSQINFTCSFIL